MRKMIFCLAILAIFSLVHAQSFTMVRCDNGDGGFLKSPADIKLDTLQAAFKSNLDTLVLVHGFNNSYSDAKESFTKAFKIFYSHLGERNYVGFYWPSDTWLDFKQGVEHADKTGPYLVHVLSQMTRWYGGSSKKIHVAGHSLGCRVLLRTLQQNEARYVKWGYCFPLAAAVHTNAYVNNFTNTNLLPKFSYVYYSKNDGVLKYLYSLYYYLFERQGGSGPEYDRWEKMTTTEKIEYLRQLDESVQNGNMPRTELDSRLYENIQRASEDAMGLVGAMLNNGAVTKVGNVDASSYVDSHFYWDNQEVLKRVAQTIR